MEVAVVIQVVYLADIRCGRMCSIRCLDGIVYLVSLLILVFADLGDIHLHDALHTDRSDRMSWEEIDAGVITCRIE